MEHRLGKSEGLGVGGVGRAQGIFHEFCDQAWVADRPQVFGAVAQSQLVRQWGVPVSRLEPGK